MKTVSTKLDKREHDRFIELCNHEGCSVSEALREMVKQWCGAVEDGMDLENKKPQNQQTPKPLVKTIDDKQPSSELKHPKVIMLD